MFMWALGPPPLRNQRKIGLLWCSIGVPVAQHLLSQNSASKFASPRVLARAIAAHEAGRALRAR